MVLQFEYPKKIEKQVIRIREGLLLISRIVA